MYQEKTLVCAECGAEFVFTADEQAFFAEKGFENDPKRCPACRQNRRRQRPMYDVVCDGCGKPTQVPFQPTEGRPVYCRDCFESRRRY
ncbi:MAG: zinc-binding protein [Clostridiaceae bacterium]|nr:zinc-binding protein [Clostridiaceae bacterium]